MTSSVDVFAFLEALISRGVAVQATAGQILFRPVSLVTEDDLACLRAYKPALLDLLQAFDPTLEALCSGLPREEAQALREERAAILEHQAGMSREEAERRAFPEQKKSHQAAA